MQRFRTEQIAALGQIVGAERMNIPFLTHPNLGHEAQLRKSPQLVDLWKTPTSIAPAPL